MAFLFFIGLPLIFSYFPYLFGYRFTIGDYGTYEGLRLVIVLIFIGFTLFWRFFPIIYVSFVRIIIWVISVFRGLQGNAEMQVFGIQNTPVSRARTSFWCQEVITRVFKSSKKSDETRKSLRQLSKIVYGNYTILLPIISVVILGVVVYFQYLNGAQLGHWMFGSNDFRLGFLWYSSILAAGWIIFSFQRSIIANLIYFLLVSLFGVIVYGFVQYFGFDPISYSTPFESFRIFSTLGNPNMFAMFLLIFIPYFLFHYRTRLAIIPIGIILCGIAASQSWSAFLLAFGIIVGFLLYRGNISRYFVGVVLIGLSISSFQLLQEIGLEAKLLGLEARYMIVVETIRYIAHSPTTLLIGGTDVEYMKYFNVHRSSELLRYIDATNVLGHSHNAILDVLSRYGFVGLSIFALNGYLLVRYGLKRISPEVVALMCILCVMASIHHVELPIWIASLVLLRYASEYEHAKSAL